MNKKLLGVLLGSMLIVGCSNTTTVDKVEVKEVEVQEETKSDEPEDRVTSAEVKKGYSIIDVQIVSDGSGNYDAEGIILNESGRVVDYCEVFVTFYDEDGNTLGTQWVNNVDLQPNDTWKFKVYGVNTESAVRCEVTKVNGF